MRWGALLAAVVASLAGCGGGSDEVTASGALRLERVGSFDSPVDVAAPPGDRSRLLVVEQGGTIRLVRDGRVARRPFLDLRSRVRSGGEQGLLSVAFAPDYARSRLLYVFYTGTNGDVHVDQLRAAASGDEAVASSRRTTIVVPHHDFANHNGGQLAFGPDRDLYVGVGDGGSEEDPNHRGQALDTDLAKILRIAPKVGGGYAIPAGNPFAGRPGARPETWAYGLRNPYRFSFDRSTGALVIGDVGQSEIEEIDYAPRGTGAGANYGWSIFEGTHRFRSGDAPGAVEPVLEESHDDGWCAIIGGYVVRDPSLPALAGQYVYGDNCKPGLSAARLSRGGATGRHALGLKVPGLSSFGEDAAGHVYATSLSGAVWRLAAR